MLAPDQYAYAPLPRDGRVSYSSADGLGDEGVDAVRSDHDCGPFLDRPVVAVVSADADDVAVLDDHVLDCDAFADLHVFVERGVDEQLVEDRPPRRGGALRILGHRDGVAQLHLADSQTE